MIRYGVDDAIWRQILAACAKFTEVEHVILYGSRARGDDSTGSDIDLAIDAPHMTSRTFAALWNALDDLPIIFPMDVVHLQSLSNPSLLQAIQKDGIKLV